MALRIIPGLGCGFCGDCATAHVINFPLGELSEVAVHVLVSFSFREGCRVARQACDVHVNATQMKEESVKGVNKNLRLM
jgi:hypothetical protein